MNQSVATVPASIRTNVPLPITADTQTETGQGSNPLSMRASRKPEFLGVITT
jgi:hypothetical protein